MIRGLAVAAREAPGEPADDFLVGDLDREHAREAAIEQRHHVGQRFGLMERAREAVEDEPGTRIRFRQPLLHQPIHHFVWHQIAAIHIRLGSRSDFGLVFQVVAKEAAR